MLLAAQPHGCINSIPALPSHATTHYTFTKLFNSLLSPPAVTVRVEPSFTSDSSMAYWSTDPFDQGPMPPRRSPPPRSVSGNQISSPGLRTFRRANAELQAELKHSPARRDDDGLNTRPTPRDGDSKPDPVQRRTRSPEDEFDVFEVQRHTPSSSNSQQLDNYDLANQLESPGVSPTNNASSNAQTLTQETFLTPPTHNQGVEIVETRRLRSPLHSPQRDPRHLFGSQETHLPWVRKLSPNQFAMNVSPNMLPRDAPPPKSVWAAEDDEFDRWPTAVQAREELDAVRREAMTKRSTFVKPNKPELSVAEQIAEAVDTPMGDGTRTEDEQEQTILELDDMDCGNPWGRDLHDDIVEPFRSRDYTVLPAHAPARHMHVIDAKAYTSSTDSVTKAAQPRLCDAVATVLAYTSPECLEAFLNPEVEVFEWRRLGKCVMIRREGKEVLIGNYYNFGAMYQWGYLIRSTIDADGAWSETWASVSQGTTPVEKDRVLFEQFEAEGTDWNVEPDSEEFALYMGRQLAGFLLRYEVWNYYRWWRYKVEWEADGKVTNAREKNRFPAGLTFD